MENGEDALFFNGSVVLHGAGGHQEQVTEEEEEEEDGDYGIGVGSEG